MSKRRLSTTKSPLASTPRSDPQAGSFRLALSNAELSWLAAAFGFFRLTLPVPLTPLKGDQISKAQESLASRDLIRLVHGTGCQVERLTAFLVHWLGETERCAFIESLRRNGGSRKGGIYQWKGLYLLVWCDPDKNDFEFFADDTSLWNALTQSLDLAQVRTGKGNFRLPESLAMVRLTWKDAEAAQAALRITGMPKTAISSTVAWIDSLSATVIMTPFPAGTDLRPVVLCSDGKSLWMNPSESTKEMDKFGDLQPSSLSKVTEQIRKFIR